MTSHQSNHEIDGEGALVANAAESRPTLDAETLQQWQSELDGFVLQIRGRLQSLSESVTHWRTRTTIHRVAYPARWRTREKLPMPQTIDAETAATRVSRKASGSPKNRLRPSLDLDLAEDADPLERLKLRLAKQIENA